MSGRDGAGTTGTDPIPDLMGLVNALRVAGIQVDTGRVLVAMDALTRLEPLDRTAVYWGTRLTLCSRQSDLPVFDEAFANWFDARAVAEPDSAAAGASSTNGEGPPHGEGVPVAEPTGDITDPADGSTDPAQATIASGADATVSEMLAHRDLRTLTVAERAELDAWIALLGAVGPTYRSRRQRDGGRRTIDGNRTVRTMIRNGGEPAHLRFRRTTPKPRRLTLLIDVSESMRVYREAFVRFAHGALSARPATTEVFTLGTRCVRLTPALRTRDPDGAMRAMAELESGWGGGTLLGRTLRDFLRQWGGRNVVRSAYVVIASDGYDFGPVVILARQVERLSQLTRLLVWANPQQGWPGYQPMAPGLLASQRFVDRNVAGHSFEALSELAELISR
ncbi:VWA domain-containing protein [Micromonospora sonneratiae]